MSDITDLINIFVKATLDLVKSHGIIVGSLAMIGLVSIIGAVFSKLFQSVKVLFTFFIALPLIALVGIFKFSDRNKRKKEIGELRAYVKDNPDKFKKFIYGLLITIFFVIIGIIILWLIFKFFRPLLQLNSYSKDILQNYTYNKS